MRLIIFSILLLLVSQLFCQIDFYIETDESCYSFGQDIHITFNLHNTTSDTVIVTFGMIPPYDYYIDDEFFLIGAYQMIVDITIPPNSTHSTPYIHTDNVSIGDHILIGEFNSYWLSDPVSITVEQVSVEKHELPLVSYHLSNYPNPFNPSTTIDFSIHNNSEVELTVYNIKGQKIKTLTHNEFTKGYHSIIWNGDDESRNAVSSGIYLYKLNVNDKIVLVKKCLLLK